MNHLESTHALKNRYFIQRHGEGKANKLGIILSNPIKGVHSYGLTHEGRKQSREGAEHARDSLHLDHTTRICSSNFLRAAQLPRKQVKY